MSINEVKVFGWNVLNGEVSIHSEKSNSFYIQYKKENGVIKIFQKNILGLPQQEDYKKYSCYSSYYPLVVRGKDASYTIEFWTVVKLKRKSQKASKDLRR